MKIDREINFRETINELSTDLLTVEYDNGDITDIGNEVGYNLGNILRDMTEEEIELFIIGFRHGVSLTNGTH